MRQVDLWCLGYAIAGLAVIADDWRQLFMITGTGDPAVGRKIRLRSLRYALVGSDRIVDVAAGAFLPGDEPILSETGNAGIGRDHHLLFPRGREP